MPIYDYACSQCDWHGERQTRIAHRNEQVCGLCGGHLTLQVSAVYGRMAGQVVQGGGPDRHTAEVLGMPLKELPDCLKQDYDTTTGKLRAPR